MSRLPFAALALPLVLASTAAVAVEAPHEPLSFTVLRNGEPVGTHVLRFQPQPEGVGVAVDTNVVVKMAMITVYRFEHHGQEVWNRDQLVSLNSTTNDDGDHHTLKVAAGSAGLDVNGDGKATRMPGATVPASLWNRATVAQGTLLNTLDGHAMTVKITDMGEDTVTVHGRSRPAHHYSMAGDLARELWYDGSGTLVQVRFKAKDDSDIQYVLN
ncbi:MAG TPA: DUF6134 family protein [Magnetospirillum sp.]|jgi:hypothetical protein|nr:DUF6134 family protein [Magnetospirillum sp.]